MIRVSASISSPRLSYVLDFMSGYFEKKFVLSDSADAEVIYGQPAGRGLHIASSGLLFEKGIHNVEVDATRHTEGFMILFPNEGAFGFDLFSAIFYLLARYEEYRPHGKDHYGRFPHRESIAFRQGFLQEPLIHRWLEHFAEQLWGESFMPEYRFHPTYDIDMAWSYKHKGFARNAGGFFRSLMARDGKAAERLSVLFGRSKDPFDAYDYLEELHAQLPVKPHYFIHAGTRRNKYDKNIPLNHPSMIALVQRLSRNAEIGLHPSWASGDEPALLAEEKSALEAVVGKPITSSRQHFIRFTLPETFRRLIAAGISDDYSMGYGSINGFRASVSVPFYWYDLEREEQSSLRLHPFCFMDANAFYEEKKNAEDMERQLFYYDEQHYTYGGDLVTIWHNTLLGSSPEFDDWARNYAFFARTITSPD